jgi:hypothetical protein
VGYDCPAGSESQTKASGRRVLADAGADADATATTTTALGVTDPAGDSFTEGFVFTAPSFTDPPALVEQTVVQKPVVIDGGAIETNATGGDGFTNPIEFTPPSFTEASVVCLSGFYAAAGTCIECQAGTYCPGDTDMQVECGRGNFCGLAGQRLSCGGGWTQAGGGTAVEGYSAQDQSWRWSGPGWDRSRLWPNVIYGPGGACTCAGYCTVIEADPRSLHVITPAFTM